MTRQRKKTAWTSALQVMGRRKEVGAQSTKWTSAHLQLNNHRRASPRTSPEQTGKQTLMPSTQTYR
jgi:hypothetical protein